MNIVQLTNNQQQKEFPSINLCKQIGHLFSESEYNWINIPEGIPCYDGATYEPGWQITKGKFNTNDVPAPTVVEMLERLPKKIKGHKDLCICFDDNYSQGGWWIGYEGKTLANEISASARTFPDLLAKMLAHLDKEGVL